MAERRPQDLLADWVRPRDVQAQRLARQALCPMVEAAAVAAGVMEVVAEVAELAAREPVVVAVTTPVARAATVGSTSSIDRALARA